jgi:hypothetical protein
MIRKGAFRLPCHADYLMMAVALAAHLTNRQETL